MFESGKKRGTVQRQARPAVRTPQPVIAPRDDQTAIQRRVLNRQTFTPVTAQAKAVQPILRASELHHAEVQRLAVQRQALQQQAQSLPPLSAAAMQAALQRQQATPAPLPLKPQSNADWVTVMRFQAEQADGRTMNSRESMQFTALQRQIMQRLTQGYLGDRQPALQRQQEYAGHVVALQRHPLSGVVGQAFMRNVPPGERPALQRAVDEAIQRQAEQEAQDQVARQRHSVQRQLAELDQEATMPVFERIQSRRGAGNPLPEAVQRHLEQGLNHDLSAVRIHDDQEADKMAKGVNAVAFTTGRDIYFQSGKFNPNTQSGLELLAHEVTHTVQQSKGQVGKGVDPDSGLESEARTMGRTLANKKFSAGPIKARALPKVAPLTSTAVQRLQAKPQMTWAELQAVLKAKLLNRLNQNSSQLKTETMKYQKTGATPQWQNLLKLIETDRQIQAKQQKLIQSIRQQYPAPTGLAGLPFPAKLKGQAAAPDPAYWLSYIQTVTNQRGAQGGPYIEAMRQLAASEGLRAAAHKAFPAISALATTTTALTAEKSPQLLGEMKGQFAKTNDAIGKLRAEIQAGKIPWKYTDLAVQDILNEYGVKQDAPAVQAYQQALKSEKTSEVVGMLLTAGVSVAAILASGPASLALGVVAAASGAGQAYLETQDVRKQLDVAEAGRFGQNLTSVKVDAAQFQVAMGYLNTALSVIDVAAIAKVVAVASGSVLVGQGMVRLERMLGEQGLMTSGRPALAGAAAESQGQATARTMTSGSRAGQRGRDLMDAGQDTRLAQFLREELAAQKDFWQLIRTRQDDIPKIAKLVGIPNEQVQLAKQHFMVRYQLLNAGSKGLKVARFKPYAEDAILWQRVINGEQLRPVELDHLKKLISHEYHEANFLGLHPELMDQFLKKGDLFDDLMKALKSKGIATKNLEAMEDRPVTPYRYAHLITDKLLAPQPKGEITSLYEEMGLIKLDDATGDFMPSAKGMSTLGIK